MAYTPSRCLEIFSNRVSLSLSLTFSSREASFKTLQHQHCRYNVSAILLLLGCHRVVPLSLRSLFFSFFLFFFLSLFLLRLPSFPFHPHFLRPSPATVSSSPFLPFSLFSFLPPRRRHRGSRRVVFAYPLVVTARSCPPPSRIILSSFSGSHRAPFHRRAVLSFSRDGDRLRFTEAYVPSSRSLPIPPSAQAPLKFPWFFLVPSCVPPHNYRNDSVNSCALSPRSSSRASINLT